MKISQLASTQRVFVGVLLLISMVVFIPALTGDWLGDDDHLVVEAECAHGVSKIPDILLENAGRCNYRPLRYVSYAVDYSLWGLNPLGYHLSNLAIHLLAVLLVYLILIQFGFSWKIALFGAALFAVHPVQVDSVGYISGRRDILMGLGYLVAFYSAMRLSEARQNEARIPTLLAWAGLAVWGSLLSVFSKEMGVTIIATIALYFLCGGYGAFAKREASQKSIAQRIWQFRWLLLALSIPSIVMLIWRGILHPVSTVTHLWFGGSFAYHLATVFSIHGRYVELIFVPIRLAGDYAPPVTVIPDSIFTLPVLFGFVWLAFLIAAAVKFYKKSWLCASFGIFWYLITMLPVSHIIPHHEPAAEHYLYIPIIGLILCGVDLAQRFWQKIDLGDSPRVAEQNLARKRILIVLACALVTLIGWRSYDRSFDYQGEVAHAGATVRYFPASVRGRARLGTALLKTEGFEAARPHLEYVLGTEFQGSARQDVLRILGEYFVKNSRYNESVRLLEEFLSVQPKNESALNAISKAYFELGRADKAFEVNQKLVNIQPKSAEYRYKLALTAFLLKDMQTANQQIAEALQIDPAHLDSLLLGANLNLIEYPREAQDMLNRAAQALGDAPEDERPSREELLKILQQKLDP